MTSTTSPTGFIPEPDLPVYDPTYDPLGYGVLGADWGTPYAKPLKDHVKAIDIEGTPYTSVLWANGATRVAGLWHFHIALSTAPLEPLYIDSLQKKGVELLQMGDKGWLRGDGDWEESKTLHGTTGHQIALRINGIDYEVEPFPIAPHIDVTADYRKPSRLRTLEV